MMQGIGTLGGGQARPWYRAPDVLTALRIPLAVAFLVADSNAIRLAIVLTAGFTDVVDGMWARRLGGSRIGAFLDPLCDKIFMAAGFYVVFRSGLLQPLEILGVLLRDILAVLGYGVVTLLRRPTSLPARAGGKAVTFCQLLTIGASVVMPEIVRPLAWATVAISVYAIADYTRAAWRR
jgi:phosphatidylglycerophosphate synthase